VFSTYHNDDPEDVQPSDSLSSSSLTYSSSSLSKDLEVSVDDMVLVLWGLLKHIYFEHGIRPLIIHPASSSIRSSLPATFKSCTVIYR
jgi:hypothetical protein